MSFAINILALYSVLSLTSMAGMNLGFLLVFLWFGVAVFGMRASAFLSIRETSGYKPYRMTALLLFVTCTLSLLVAKVLPYAYAGHEPDITLHGVLKIWYMICPLVLAVVFSAQKLNLFEGIAFITRAWWSMTILLGAIAIIQFNTGWPLRQVIPTNPEHFHATLFLGHHLSTASILIFPAFTALAVALGAWIRNRKTKKLEWLAGISGVLILFLSYARTAWLALPLGLILIFVRYLKPKTFLASTAALLLALVIGSQTPAMKERIQNSMGIQDRLRLWEANIDYFKHRPITGIGWLKTQEMSEFYFKEKHPDNYKDYFWGHAHNNFFEMLGGTGILGTIAFLLWSLFTIRFSLQTRKLAEDHGQHFLSDLASGITVALLLLHFNGLTNVTFWEGKVMHQQMFSIGLLFMIQIAIGRSAKKIG
ncbi:MAG: O-antigen ligase family protein [Bdellovibrionales bacterium]|nr:O-antigen ligase family protein [Bdellovibrionales bacterium]